MVRKHYNRMLYRGFYTRFIVVISNYPRLTLIQHWDVP